MPAFQPIPREKVIAVIEKAGPVQPLDVRRELHEGDTVLIGAILSEMTASGKVAISKTKRGGSPFYYDPAKPESLERISQFLPEKDARTFALLKEAGVLRDDEQEPLTRVSLQNIPDFSRRFAADGVAFWRYYLVREEDAIVRVRAKLSAIAQPAAEPLAAPAMPVVPAAPAEPAGDEGKKPRKRSAKRPQKKASAQQTFQQPTDQLHERAERSLGARLSDLEVRKPETEVAGVHVAQGPHGKLHTFVCAIAKKLTEKTVLKAILEARGKGMPLLLLTTEEIPKKLEETFDETPNVSIKRI
jgi:hypothetical protein